jgi:hypothetical protein
VDAGSHDTDDERVGDLTVRVATGDECHHHLGLAPRQTEIFLRVFLARVWWSGGEVEPRTLPEQLELSQQGRRADPCRESQGPLARTRPTRLLSPGPSDAYARGCAREAVLQSSVGLPTTSSTPTAALRSCMSRWKLLSAPDVLHEVRESVSKRIEFLVHGIVGAALGVL